MSISPSSINHNDVKALCKYFKKNSYSVPNETPEAKEALDRCKALLELDYNVVEINNAGGVLCAHYPSRILICENELPYPGSSPIRNEALHLDTEADVNQLRNQILKARKGRCRARFPVPVILFRGKNICRSGTIAHYAEIYGRATVEAVNSYIYGTSEDDFDDRGDEDQFNDEQALDLESTVRNNDIQLLRMYSVNTIFDLMVEHKKVKYGVYVTSSEKADTENRYSDFNVINIPYPGCEFFKEFYHHGKQGRNLVFDWDQRMVDKTLSLPTVDNFKDLEIEWGSYKTWDIIDLTTNYLAFVLRYIQQSKDGVLIHCISGWDRTPLFISLIRVSLWADGLIHKSLNPTQMLYFTIAYDWMLFGHNLKNRIEKFEEIFFFGFYMLKHIMPEKCSIKCFYRGNDDPSPQVSPKKVISADNGNTEFMDDDLLGSNASQSSSSTNLFNEPAGGVILEQRESETEMNVESDIFDNENGDFCGYAPLLLDDNSDMVMPDSQSSNESNGNLPAEKQYSDNDVNNSPSPSRKSSPVPISGSLTGKDSDASNSSWTFVSVSGSVHSNDEFTSLRERVSLNRFKRLSKVRNDFIKAYYHAAIVPYTDGSSSISQVVNHFAEKVGWL
ncbi:hypothetical protein WA026_010454 [Henosepilachna vigintioctopunctata]|uniref:Myotubularin phosphatase domain-containing protein n=1 Tax=Henosepilachna vigintioctopunctata TaxID=420089 RepID=A0AAW1V531_9CUCU